LDYFINRAGIRARYSIIF